MPQLLVQIIGLLPITERQRKWHQRLIVAKPSGKAESQRQRGSLNMRCLVLLRCLATA
jgi:hypothetical protein